MKEPLDPDTVSDRASTTGTPRWVKVFGAIALAVILLFVVLLLAGGPHNPGRHASGNSRHAEQQR